LKFTGGFPQGFASPERITAMGDDRDYGDSISTKLTYFLVGAGIGAVLALLFAPKSGEELRSDIADATRKGIDRSKEAAQQIGAKAGEYYDTTRQKAGELYDTARETAGEYYEATRERATDLYDTASAKAGEVVSKTKGAVSSQAGSISAAVEAGKKAYIEEKRKTELSGRTEAAPTYTPEKSM
jgi:gas vesicle protein